jgi:hypothetical protein
VMATGAVPIFRILFDFLRFFITLRVTAGNTGIRSGVPYQFFSLSSAVSHRPLGEVCVPDTAGHVLVLMLGRSFLVLDK